MPNPIDITDQQFGRLVALRVEGTKPRRWLCRCICGNYVVVITEYLMSGNTKSCGCLHKDRARENIPKHTKNMAGQRFGKLVALDQHDQVKSRWRWLCQCDCGKQIIVAQQYLQNGHTRSCGCLYFGNTNGFKHGHARRGAVTPTYVSWSMMRRRCTDPNATGYKNYGGRGIAYRNRWEPFITFLSDMGERSRNETLERVNNDADYGPDNCVWATRSEQMQNSRPYHRSTIAVLDIITRAERPLSPKEVAILAGLIRVNVQVLLLQLVKRGKLKKVGRGLYAIAEP